MNHPALWGAIAPAAPWLADLLIDLMFLLGWVVCLGLLWAWRHTIGAGIRAVASTLDIHVFGRTIPLGGALRALDDVVTRNLGAWANTTHALLGRFWLATARLTTEIGHEIAAIAEDTAAWGKWLEHAKLPKWVKWSIRAAFPVAYLTKLIVDQIRKVLPHLLKLVKHETIVVENKITKTIVRPVVKEVIHITKVVKGAAAATAATVTGAATHAWEHVHVLPRINALERWEGRTKKRLARLEKIFAAAGAAAIMANALGLPNWRCITRGNLGRAARRICGMDTSLLDSLLLDGLAVLSAVSVVEFANDLRAVEDEAIAIMEKLVVEWPSG